MSDFLTEAKARGFVHQCTDEEGLSKALNSGTVTAYLGFDPTASSLHVGNLVGIMYLRLLQKHGHRPIALMGGGTVKLGDPSGRDETRQLITDDIINTNINSIRPVFARYLDFSNDKALLINNNDWLCDLNYITFLRDIGRHFSVNRMLSFESIKLRLDREQNLSFLEFNYMLLQSYDFLELYKKYGCILQLGGSDQWGNIVSGVELVRKVLGKTTYGLTAPLITTSNGAKMGKTAKGAVWLNADLVSPYDYWQFWRNTADADVIRYMKLFTDLSLDEIERLSKLEGSAINDAKKILADEATQLLHGTDCLKDIHQTVNTLFEAGSGDLASLPEFTVSEISEKGISVLDLFVLSNLATSKGEARRLMVGGGIKVNDVSVSEETFYHTSDFPLKLSAGKKRHALVKA